MNYATQTEQLHTFTDVPRLEINRWHIMGISDWEGTDKITAQIACKPDVIPASIVTFIDNLHNAPYRSNDDVELLKRFAGAMGLDYPNAPGLKK